MSLIGATGARWACACGCGPQARIATPILSNPHMNALKKSEGSVLVGAGLAPPSAALVCLSILIQLVVVSDQTTDLTT